MCGIAGAVFRSDTDLTHKEELIKDLMHPRGPDNFGKFIYNNTHLFHTRLKILDLTDEANQPYSHSNMHMVYNGEIYNFEEIRSMLEGEGYVFKTRSDTEVLLKGYHCFGKEIFNRLRGMFALAILDTSNEKLIVARDYIGKKPLYYHYSHSEFIFSSDIRVVKEVSSSKFDINWESVNYYLSELSSPQPYTIWDGIFQVEPGAIIEFDTRSFTWKQSFYYTFNEVINPEITEEEAIINIENLLTAAIKQRVKCDVPYGCFLSGGIDSGLITALLAESSSEKVKTFTVGFKNSSFDESDKARRVSERYQTDHTEIFLTSEISETITDLIEYVGEPFADSSILPTYYISKSIKEHVTVALSGDGGDELFGGYPQYLKAYAADLFEGRWANSKWKNQVIFADKVVSRFQGNRENLGSLNHLLQQETSLQLSRGMAFSEEEKRQLLKPEVYQRSKNFTEKYTSEIWKAVPWSSLSNSIMVSSLHTRLLNDYLVKIDRASMKNSLEIRSPFLDQDLLQYAFTLPRHLLFKGDKQKYILRNLASKYLGKEFLEDPKQGFNIPMYDWYGAGSAKWVDELLKSLEDREDIVNKDYIRKLKTQNLRRNTHKIWALICLELWLRNNI